MTTRRSVLLITAVLISIGLCGGGVTGTGNLWNFDNTFQDVDSITTATADTLLVDWSDTTKLPAWANTVYITQFGVSALHTVSSFDFQLDILVSGSTQSGSYLFNDGTPVGAYGGIGKDWWSPLVFKRANGNVKFVVIRTATATCDLWIRGWYER